MAIYLVAAGALLCLGLAAEGIALFLNHRDKARAGGEQDGV